MKLLALDCSSKTASVAICDGSRLIGQVFINAGLTHSETLLPAVSQLLEQSHTGLEQLEGLAVTHGPGSFTGLRIGVAAVLGLAWARSLPCCGVSSLEATAWNVRHMESEICAVMDARREQVYRAFFEPSAKGLARLTDDCAVSIDELRAEIAEKKIILVGDGALLCYNSLVQGAHHLPKLVAAPEHLRYPTGYGVAMAAQNGGTFTDASKLTPVYLRIPQAERERIRRLGTDGHSDGGRASADSAQA